MKTEKFNMKMPPVLPHGWKKSVAATLGIHINTITNSLKRGEGEMYNRILKTALEKYGIPTKK
ncbi:MAG: hypothetical protein RBT57_02975 [Paludibacter sp.]|jgi:hypothetical protein|nr:hypothetical protein [Paludibacter sp.]